MPVNFDTIYTQIKEDASSLIKTSFAEYVNETKDDLKSFLNESKTDLKRYTEQYLQGELTKDEVAFLVEGKKDLLAMKTLERTGVAKVRIHVFKGKLINIIVKSITGGISI